MAVRVCQLGHRYDFITSCYKLLQQLTSGKVHENLTLPLKLSLLWVLLCFQSTVMALQYHLIQSYRYPAQHCVTHFRQILKFQQWQQSWCQGICLISFLLIAFRSSSNAKLSVQMFRSVAAGGISVDLSSFLTFSSSLKYPAHSFISLSLSVGDSSVYLFTNVVVFVVDFRKISLMVEYSLLNWLRWAASSACKHLFSRNCWLSFSVDSSVNFAASLQLP